MKTRQGTLTLLLALALCLGVLPLAPLSAAEAGGSILARLPAAAYHAAALPAMRVLDYGRFVWLELTAAQFARLQASGQPYQAYTEPFTLRLGELSFDPVQGMPDLPAGWEPVRADGPDLHLVQLAGPTQARCAVK